MPSDALWESSAPGMSIVPDPYQLKQVGNVVGSVVKPLVQAAPALAGEIGGQLAFSTRANRKLMKQRYNDLLNNRLGFTQGQKLQMGQEGQDAINAQLAPQQDALNRMTAASGIQSGATANQQAALANAAAAGAAQLQGQIQNMSQQQVLQRDAEIRQQLANQSQIAKDDWRRVGSILQGAYGTPQQNDTSFIDRASQYAGQMG